MAPRPRLRLLAPLVAGLLAFGCAAPVIPPPQGGDSRAAAGAGSRPAPSPATPAPHLTVIPHPAPAALSRPQGRETMRAYAAPDRHADALTALAEEARTRPSTLAHATGTLWRWATGAFRRGTPVAVAPRGETPSPTNFWVGANLPWVHYGGDFGANAWSPQGGVARPEAAAELDAAFARFAAAGVTRVRWFMFCDGRAGLRFAADGTPAGLDDFVFADVDAALAAARKHHVRVMFALLDFYFLQAEQVSGEVRMRGHADVFRDPAKRKAFMATVVAPLADRYGHDDAVFAWDVINEPEWSVFGAGAWKPGQSVAPSDLRDFVREATATFHERATQPVTVGSASTRWLDLVAGLGLDFYQPHWYDHFEKRDPLATPVTKLDVDRPVVLGEYPTKGSKKTPAQILDAVRGAGFGGGFAWAQLSTDEATDWAAAEPGLIGWIQDHAGHLAP